MIRIVLSAIMDRGAVDTHRDELRGALSGGESVEIGCGGGEQIGLAGLQLLASAPRTGRKSGGWKCPPDVQIGWIRRR